MISSLKDFKIIVTGDDGVSIDLTEQVEHITEHLGSSNPLPTKNLILDETIAITATFDTSPDMSVWTDMMSHGIAEYGTAYWFLPRFRSSYDMENIQTVESEKGFHVTFDWTNPEDLTDYRIRARLLRWLWRHSSTLRWIAVRKYE